MAGAIYTQLPPDPHPADRVLEMILEVAKAPLISAAAELGIADLLQDGPKTVDELAKATGTHPLSLYRALRTLASVGIFREKEPRRFEMTRLAEPLLRESEGSLREFAVMCGRPWVYQTWANFMHCLKTGKPSFDEAFGSNVFEYFNDNSEEHAIFHDGMTSKSKQDALAICEIYDFSPFQTIVDVGGGHGYMMSEILQLNPKARGIVFDQETVAPGSHKLLTERGHEGRFEVVHGDFFKSVPKGGDLYILKYIIHDWDDEHVVTVLKNIRSVIKPEGKLVVADAVVPAGNTPAMGKYGDAFMMAVSVGRERTEAEFRELFTAGGFELERVIPTRFYLSVMELSPSRAAKGA